MDQRYVDAASTAAGVDLWPPFPASSMVPADPSTNFYVHRPVEGIPIVVDVPPPKVRAQDYHSQPGETMHLRKQAQDGPFASVHSSREDDRGSNISEDMPSSTRVKLLCSYGGKILPRPSDGTLRYVGGETRMITVGRDISFGGVMAKMIEVQPQTISIKYQLPDEDLDALVSVSSGEDLENMMEEFDKLETSEHPRLRVFLFTASDSDESSLSDNSKNTEQQYLDAVNGLSEGVTRKLSDASTQSSASFAGAGAAAAGLAGAPAAANPVLASQNTVLAAQSPVLGPQNPVLAPQNHVLASQNPVILQQNAVYLPDQMFSQPPPPVLQPVPEMPPPAATLIWATDKPNLGAAPIYVGVPLDKAHLYGNGPTAYTNAATANLSTWSSPFISESNPPHSEPSSQHVSFTQTQSGGYGIFSQARIPELPLKTDPMSLYEYQPEFQKPPEAYTGLNGGIPQPIRPPQPQPQPLPDWSLPLNDAKPREEQSPPLQDQKVLRGATIAAPRGNLIPGISEFTGWSADDSVDAPSSGSMLLSSTGLSKSDVPEVPTSHQLPPSLVNFLEDSIHVVTTSVAEQMPTSGNSSSNMPLDLLTSDDFTRTSCASTGSTTLPSGSAASSASYGLDVAGAVTSDSPSRIMENLILFEDDNGTKQNAEVQVSTTHDALASSFAFVAEKLENRKVASGKSDDEVRKLASSEGKCDRALDTSDLHSPNAPNNAPEEPVREPEQDLGLEAMLPDVPDISESDGPGLSAAETEAIARARGLQVIKHEDLEEIRELGSGTFGTVYHGKWRGTDVAIKRIKASCFFGSPSEQGRLKDDFWGEASILARLHHPNVVAFYGVVPDSPGGTLATVTEFMVNGSLKQVLQKKDSLKNLDRRRRLLIAMDAAFGMEYLHDKKIIHFDLKGENLLVNMRDPHRPICKVGDLGLSKIKHKTMISGGVRGTLPWMAPELLNGKSIMVTEKVDVFSFGVVMWELLTGEEPYADLHYGAIIGGIVNNSLRPQIPNHCEPEWRTLMERCWADDPMERPTFSEIVKELRSIMHIMLAKQQHAQQQAQQAQAQAQAQQQVQVQSQQVLGQTQQVTHVVQGSHQVLQHQQQVQVSQQQQVQLQQEIAHRQQQVQQLQAMNAHASQQLHQQVQHLQLQNVQATQQLQQQQQVQASLQSLQQQRSHHDQQLQQQVRSPPSHKP